MGFLSLPIVPAPLFRERCHQKNAHVSVATSESNDRATNPNDAKTYRNRLTSVQVKRLVLELMACRISIFDASEMRSSASSDKTQSPVASKARFFCAPNPIQSGLLMTLAPMLCAIATVASVLPRLHPQNSRYSDMLQCRALHSWWWWWQKFSENHLLIPIWALMLLLADLVAASFGADNETWHSLDGACLHCRWYWLRQTLVANMPKTFSNIVILSPSPLR